MKPGEPRKYEASDASTRGVLIGAASIAVGILASLGASFWLLHPHSRSIPEEESFEFGPRQEKPMERDWDGTVAESQGHLSGYGWIDRGRGVVRIPIDRAMQILAARDRPGKGTGP